MLALFFGELEEDALAFRVLEPLAVALEEAVRAALAADADAVGLEIVDPVASQLLGTRREQPVRRALEEQECRPRLEARILLEQLLVAVLERLQMVHFFGGELAKYLPRPRILHQLDAAPVKLHAAALGGNRDPQCVAREQQLRIDVLFGCGTGAARFTGAVDLHHGLSRGERARERDFFHQLLDVRAQELVRAVAGLADQVKVARMAIRMFEAEPAFAEIHLAGDARFFHPQQRAVDGGAADAVIFLLDERDEIVSAQVSLLLEERVDDQVAFAGSLRAGRAKTIQIGDGRAGGHGLDCRSLMPRTRSRSRRLRSRSGS